MGRSGRSSRGRTLSEEEQALWTEVSRSVTKVRKRDRVHRAIEPPSEEPPGSADDTRHEGDVKARPQMPASAAVSVGPRVSKSPGQSKKPAAAPDLTPLDQRRSRKIAGGRMAIEARLDLHGMYQSEAHSRLRSFVAECHRRGFRNVLVITGKGGAASAHEPFDIGARPDRGVLKRNVPLWLAEPDLRVFVVGFAPAHSRHGGEGALYIQLRNRDRKRGGTETD